MPSKLRSTTRFFFDADDVGQTASIYTDSDGCRRHDCFLARARLGFGRRRFPRVTHTHTHKHITSNDMEHMEGNARLCRRH